jgi:hypothetical protein
LPKGPKRRILLIIRARINWDNTLDGDHAAILGRKRDGEAHPPAFYQHDCGLHGRGRNALCPRLPCGGQTVDRFLGPLGARLYVFVLKRLNNNSTYKKYADSVILAEERQTKVGTKPA